ncbi:MAG TPA: hypothetical protein VIS48_13130 [Candidatus Kryptonia bacterium]
MKRTLLLSVAGLMGVLLLSALNYTPSDNKSAVLTIASSGPDTVVSFDAAYVVGDASSSTPLAVANLATPITLTIDSPSFMGIFKRKTGAGTLVVKLSKPGVGDIQVKGNVTCVTLVKDKLTGAQF